VSRSTYLRFLNTINGELSLVPPCATSCNILARHKAAFCRIRSSDMWFTRRKLGVPCCGELIHGGIIMLWNAKRGLLIGWEHAGIRDV